jgi:hypothetical protein
MPGQTSRLLILQCEHCGRDNEPLISPLHARAYMGISEASLNEYRNMGHVWAAFETKTGFYYRKSDLNEAKLRLRLRDVDMANREEIYRA